MPTGSGFGYAQSASAKFLRITGKGTAADPDVCCKWSDLSPNVVVLIENASSDINWMEPEDISIEQLRENGVGGFTRIGRQGFCVMFANGSIWELKPAVPRELLAVCTLLAKASNETTQELAKHRVF
jgi:hypothetical protein